MLARFTRIVQERDLVSLTKLTDSDLIIIGLNTVAREMSKVGWSQGYLLVREKSKELDQYLTSTVIITSEDQLSFYQEIQVRPQFVVYSLLDFSEKGQEYLKAGPYVESGNKRFKSYHHF